MERVVKIPVRLVDRTNTHETGASDTLAQSHHADVGLVRETQPVAERVSEDRVAREAGAQEGATDWYDRALRLQAEMENYRKRQQRLAQDQIESEHHRLLRAFLGVVDDLERALEAPIGDGEGLRQGVQMTHRAALQLLEREGVEQIRAEYRPFDPAWQEAVSTMAHGHAGAEPDTVVQVVEPGYRLGDQLLRPAKVVVAV
jgi:molecular chaperone GrpE